MIVDDEETARIQLRELLRDISDVTIVGEAASCSESIAFLNKTDDVDLLLLDIEMPDGTGFQLLEQLEEPPHVIFVTHYDAYALRAFEINAVDYIQKPLTRARLVNALERIKEEPKQPPQDLSLRSDDLILLNCDRKKHFVRINEILAIESEQNYTHVLRTTGHSLMVKKTLSAWSEQLPDAVFRKTGRSHIVNIKRIASLELRDGDYVLMFRDTTTELPLKRAEAKRVQQFTRKLS